MDLEALAAVTGALGIAAFARQPDGGFQPLGPAPAWFTRVTSDDTFPFLGHILEEATAFWQRGSAGRADWGPVAEVDQNGREYHYLVTALIADGRQYLVFQLDSGAERMRELLQKLRSEALSAEQHDTSYRAAAADLHRTTSDVKVLLAQLLRENPTPAQMDLLKGLSEKAMALGNGISRLIQSMTIPRV